MLDHIQITVRNAATSKQFYAAALAPLGYSVQYDKAPVIGIGANGAKIPALWLSEGAAKGATHVALIAPDRKSVDAFHKAAVAAGGRDNGPAGLRADYHATYYAAFVIDPDGNNVEAVCHL
jgi:catechol 2,3-dioxygenase-like lactoylglutathione lyase family enzyme